jgi:hypothetical protein
VACEWPEPLQLEPTATTMDDATLLGLHNPGRASRYLSAIALSVDETTVDPAAVVLTNQSPGETGVPVAADTIGPESGFYVRRAQTATIALPALAPGAHEVTLAVGLAGVAERVVSRRVEVAPPPELGSRRMAPIRAGSSNPSPNRGR